MNTNTKRFRPTVNCKCQWCGFQWSFEAKSKADAARINGPATCGKSDCTEKTSQQILEKIKQLDQSLKAERVGLSWPRATVS